MSQSRRGRRMMSAVSSLLLLALVAAMPRPAAAEALPAPSVDPAIPLEDLKLLLLPLTEAQLATESAAWQAMVQARTQTVAAQRLAIRHAQGEEALRLREELPLLVQARRASFERFEAVLQAWEAKGGDPDAIAAYRRYVSTVRSDEIRGTDASTIWATFKRWLVARDGGIRLGLALLGFAAAVLLLLAVAKVVSNFAGRGLARVRDLSSLLRGFLVRAVFWATLVLGLLTVLSWLGVRLTPILTLLGGLSFVLAFATQNTLSNFAAGLMIMVYKPFDLNDVVTIGGVTGTVREMSLVSTTLVTGDNQLIVVPNSNVWGSMITNINASPTRRVDLTFSIGYHDDEELARRILEEIVASHPLVLKQPEWVIRLHRLGDSSVDYICRPWVRTSDYWTVYWDLTRQVKDRFDEVGVSIPFPQRDIHVYTHGKPEPQIASG